MNTRVINFVKAPAFLSTMGKELFLLTVGCFDGYHSGHVRLFQRMKSRYPEGKLIVGVHDDESIFVNKKIRTIASTSDRVGKIRSNELVYDVFLVESPDPTEALRKVVSNYRMRGRFIYMRGDDWKEFPGKPFLNEKEIEIVFLPYTKGISSTKLRKRVDELVDKVFDCIYHQNRSSDEEITRYIEEAVFMPSDVVLNRIYERAYENGLADFFGDPLMHVSKLVGEAWDHEASRRLIPSFISNMNIDVNDISRDPKHFATLNDFFSRQVNLNNRPMEEDSLLISPCDSHALMYTTIEKSKELYVKGKNYTIEKLLGGRKDLVDLVEGGMIIFHRLRPWDTHRMYAPSDGTLGTVTRVSGYLHTVKQNAMVRPDITPCSENVRVIAPIYDAPTVGDYILVAVGAPLIGSITVHPQDGDQIYKGSELGYFRYGGSLVMLIFPRSTLLRSAFPVEKAGISGYQKILPPAMDDNVSCAVDSLGGEIEAEGEDSEPDSSGETSEDSDLYWTLQPDPRKYNVETPVQLRQTLVRGSQTKEDEEKDERENEKSKDPDSSFNWLIIIPCMITILNVICGYFSIVSSLRHGDVEVAAKYIILGFIADTLDGPVARWMGACSKLGAELDSFADFVTFGVATAALLQNAYSLSVFVAVLYVSVVALRLARFNTTSQTPGYHTGYASPFPAILFASAAMIFPDADPSAVASMMMVAGAMMHSDFLFWKPTAFKSGVVLSFSYLLHLITLIPALFDFPYAQVPLLALSCLYLLHFIFLLR